MRQKQDLLEAIKRFPVLHWAQAHLQGLKDSGGEDVYADCPFCNGKAKLGISISKKVFHCFRCYEGEHAQGWSGRANLVDMICLLEQCVKREAAEFILKYVGMDPTPARRQKPKESPHLPAEAVHISTVRAQYPKHSVFGWLESRVLQDIDCYVSLGGRYNGRVILPVYEEGSLVGFEAKAWQRDLKPKSLFPTWFDTSDHIYYTASQFTPATRSGEGLVVTESVFDALTLREPSIGLFGSHLKDGQLSKLLSFKKKGYSCLYWFLDWDAFSKSVKSVLRKTGVFFQNFLVPVKENEDPNNVGYYGCMHKLCAANEFGPIKNPIDLLRFANKFGLKLT